MRYYEDIEVGDVTEHGTYEMTKEEIVEFAEQYDPQPFHTDEAAAEDSIFGSLAASGWHTASACMRLLVDGVLEDQASLGAAGVDELRWKRPVHPGDELTVRMETIEKEPHPTDPTRGRVNSRMTGINGDGEAVISWIGLGMVQRREPLDEAPGRD